MSEIKEATQMVHWPGQDTPACDEHAAKLRGIAGFRGFPVSCTPTSGTVCRNCKIEAEKAS